MRRIAAVVGMLVVLGLGGCTQMTSDQKLWVQSKADRSQQFVLRMNAGQTSRETEQNWILSQNDSWALWAQKIAIGLAAPSWMVSGDAEATTQPAGDK